MEGASAGSGGAANGQDREVLIAALRESIERHTVPSHPLAALKPHPRNSRVHPPAQLDEIERSMLEWGWTMPILADEDGTILAGHGRKMVAERLGLDEAPVIFATGWSDDQKRAYIIADNKLPENAEWDPSMLKLELSELEAGGFDLSLIGFDATELAEIMFVTEGESDPESVPETPANPVTVRGDVWLIGRHRLVCGDSTNSDDVAKALNGAKPHLMVTDPPYGVEYDASWRAKAMPSKNDPKRWKDGRGRAVGAVMNDDRADWREAWVLFPGEVLYVWHGSNQSRMVIDSIEAVGFELRAQIIWNKSHFAIGRGDYHGKHEPCWYAVRKGGKGHWNGDRKQTTVWEIDKPQKSETGHSTQKPVECMQRPIENNSKPGDAVYEPFSGSGTTIIAAEMTGRVCHALELSPEYCDVAVKRWQEFTKKKARLEGAGLSFDEVAKDRSVRDVSPV